MHKLYLNRGQIYCWLRGELINIKYQLNIDLLLISWFLSWPQHTCALGSDMSLFTTKTLNASKYTWENWLKQILKNYIKLFKRKQITTKPEDCLWEWRMGKIWICAMLTILPLYSAWLCYNCVYTRGVMLLELNLLNLLLSYLILGILWLSAML